MEADIVSSVANANFKNQAELPMQYSNILLSDSLASARNMSAIREKSVARSLERMDSTQSDEVAGEGVSATLVATLAQVLAKLGQTTPPVTSGN